MNNMLTVEAKINASAVRVLRNDEIKWRNKARAAKERAMKKGANEYEAPAFYDERRMESYRDRMAYRKMSRHINLAMGFLKGLSYQQIENKTYTQPDPAVVAEWLARSSVIPAGQWNQWLEDVTAWMKPKAA